MVYRLYGFLLSSAFLFPFITGCSRSDAPPVGKVTGIVTLNGQPVPSASITFIPTEGGRPATGETDANGEYTLTFSTRLRGAKVGNNKVVIGTARDAGDKAPAVRESIPDRYNHKSDLFVDVQAGSNQFDFHLEATPAELAELTKPRVKPQKASITE